MTTRRDALLELRALPFRDAYLVATGNSPWTWNSVTTGLAAMATLWLMHGWLFLSEDNTPSLLGVALLPAAFALAVWGWVYARALLMFLGIAVGFAGAAGPFWIMNAG